MSQTVTSDRQRKLILAIDRVAWWLAQHWLGLFIVVYGVYVLAPFLAPLFMFMGATDAANAVYTGYSFVCHQLPERSIFLFGEKPMYSFGEIKNVWSLDGFLGLRQFTGTPEFGYKVAWSDRMMSFYGSIWIGALLYAFMRKGLRQLSPVKWFFFGILPVGLDGITHFFNDIVAQTSGAGFRDTNDWLRFVTFNSFPDAFYIGDALGSFNSDMRWITGFLFGLTTVWFLFPIIEDGMHDVMAQAQRQLERARVRSVGELFAAIYDPVLAPLEALGLRKWRDWATRAARGHVLEIGVGTGANLPYYRDIKAIAAIDPDGASLKRAVAKMHGRGGSFVLYQARAEELPFADGSFDAVVGTLTFCTIADPARGLREVYRVLKKGGTLRLVEHVRASNRTLAWIQEAMTPGWQVIADGCHLNRETASAVEGAGFQLRDVQGRFAGILIGIVAVK